MFASDYAKSLSASVKRTHAVDLVGIAKVTGSIYVTASSEEEAKREALRRLGDVEWKYDGLVEGSDGDEAEVVAVGEM